MLLLLFKYSGLGFRRYMGTRTVAKAITIALFMLLVVAIAVGIFFFVRAGFTLMQHEAYGRETLPLYTYEVFFLVLGYLMFVSAVISALFTLFRAGANEWVAATPNYKILLVGSILRIFESSLWPLLVIGLPAVIALAGVYGGGAAAVLSALVGLVLLAAGASGSAIVFIMALAALFYVAQGAKAGLLQMKWLALAAAALVGGATYFMARRIADMDIVRLFVSGPLAAAQADVSGITAAFWYVPTHGMALIMLALQDHAWLLAWSYLAALALAVAVVGVLIWLLSFAYLPVWQRLQEQDFEARTALGDDADAAARTAANEPPRAFPRYFRSPIGAIFEKEAVTTFRSLRDLLWILFMLGLWIIQSALNLFLHRNSAEYGVSTATIVAAIQSLQVATTVFFTSTFSLRFALPSFSVDRRMRWILGTAPISPRAVFFSKLAFYSAVFLVFGLGLGIANASILGVPIVQVGLFLATIAVMVLAITTFGLALGARFPNTESDDPEIVSTSLPGLGFTFLSLGYGALGTWIFYQALLVGALAPLAAFVALSALFIIAAAATLSQDLGTFNPFVEDIG
ncbi:MAG TPA: hypothetical protein VMT99_01990 [Candidatus Paceibacterota bacterium]|nr:hypothetical protein [Candidatus Paceibacterota bacterium]